MKLPSWVKLRGVSTQPGQVVLHLAAELDPKLLASLVRDELLKQQRRNGGAH